MSNSKLKYVVAGAVICLLALVFLSAGGDGPEKEVGRYQITAAGEFPSVFIMDTKTGTTKMVWSASIGGPKQLGISFDEMKDK